MSESVRVAAKLAICPRCQHPMVVENGKAAKPVTFWTDASGPRVTMHADDCPNRGQAATP